MYDVRAYMCARAVCECVCGGGYIALACARGLRLQAAARRDRASAGVDPGGGAMASTAFSLPGRGGHGDGGVV